MVDDYIRNKVLHKIKEIIDIEILIDTDDQLPDDITLKNVVIWITCDIQDNKFYPQILLEKALLLA